MGRLPRTWRLNGSGVMREKGVKGDSKILTFGDWDNVNTHQKDWKWICLGSNIMLS